MRRKRRKERYYRGKEGGKKKRSRRTRRKKRREILVGMEKAIANTVRPTVMSIGSPEGLGAGQACVTHLSTVVHDCSCH